MLIFERWGRWGGTYELRGESNLRSRIPWLEPPRPANEVLPRLPLCLRWDWTLVPLAHETLATRYYRLGFLFNVQMFNSNSTVCLAKACTLMADYYWELSPFWGIQSTTLIHSSSVRHSYNFGTSQTLLNSLRLTCPQRVVIPMYLQFLKMKLPENYDPRDSRQIAVIAIGSWPMRSTLHSSL